jgi:hypothetical protein
MRRLLIGLGLAAAALFFSAAARADQITAVQVSPASPQAASAANVTLQGTGTCNSLVFDWGDQSAAYSHGSQLTLPFPLPPHTYSNAGNYTLTVTGVKGCIGKGLSTTITVAAKTPGVGIVDLCKHVDCGGLLGSKGGLNPGIKNFPLLELQPKIDYFGFSNFTPGGEVTIVGSGFGNSPGALHIVGYGPVISFKLPDGNIPILSWKDTLIVATIPANIAGVVDQPVVFYVVTANNLKSKYSLTVPFVATREVKKIPYGDPAVMVVSCGTDSNLDQCNNWSDPDDGGPLPDLSTWGGTLAGNHLNCWGCFGDDVGADVYQVSVANGWILDQVFFSAMPSDPGEASAVLNTSLPPGASAWQPSVSWVVTSGDFIHYTMDLYTVGPKGVPYH